MFTHYFYIGAMDSERELINSFRQYQEKYTYYLIALCVTSIGFSVFKTTGIGLKLSQIPLGLAVLSWGISIYCGLTFLKYIMSNLYANTTYLEILGGRNKEVGNHPEMINAAAGGIMGAMESNNNIARKLSRWQNGLFYLGMALFLLWHLIEMYLH
jgi:hypothetical protein